MWMLQKQTSLASRDKIHLGTNGVILLKNYIWGDVIICYMFQYAIYNLGQLNSKHVYGKA